MIDMVSGGSGVDVRDLRLLRVAALRRAAGKAFLPALGVMDAGEGNHPLLANSLSAAPVVFVAEVAHVDTGNVVNTVNEVPELPDVVDEEEDAPFELSELQNAPEVTTTEMPEVKMPEVEVLSVQEQVTEVSVVEVKGTPEVVMKDEAQVMVTGVEDEDGLNLPEFEGGQSVTPMEMMRSEFSELFRRELRSGVARGVERHAKKNKPQGEEGSQA